MEIYSLLFIYGLFNDAISISENMLQDRMIGWLVKDKLEMTQKEVVAI
jgi:hypothetical protein